MPLNSSTPSESNTDDVIIVTLPKRDYDVLRQVIDNHKGINWFCKYVKTFIMVFIGVVISFLTMGEQILNGIKHLLGIS